MRKYTLALLIMSAFSILFFTSCKDKKKAEKKETKTVVIPKKAPKPVVKVKPAPAPKPVIKKVVVKEGEWLYNISRREYGTSQGWIKIYNANKAIINDPNLIFPNQELVIPD